MAEAMERSVRGVHKANLLAQQIGEASFIAIMDKLQIEVDDNHSRARIPQDTCDWLVEHAA